jgi:uncharacterized protein YjbI with pentapeptide repeats
MQGKEAFLRQAFLQALKEMDPNAMQGARLRGSDLSGLDLAGISFRKADLNNANLFKAEAVRNPVSFEGASFYLADMRQVEFLEANFTEAVLEKTNLSGARLWGGTDLHMAKLIGTDLTNAVFQDPEDKAKSANLEGATIDGAVLISANLSHTRLVGAIFHNITQWDEKTDFEDANCQKAQFDTSSKFYVWGQKKFPECFKPTKSQPTTLPQKLPPITTPPPPINISGTWHGGDIVYRFNQKMSTLEVTAENSTTGMKASGNGTIAGNQIELWYKTNIPGRTGTAIGSVSADAKQITLQIYDSVHGTSQHVLVR